MAFVIGSHRKVDVNNARLSLPGILCLAATLRGAAATARAKTTEFELAYEFEKITKDPVLNR